MRQRKWEQVYSEPKEFMSNIIVGDIDDYLSSNPLEIAYLWTLACRSAMDKKLTFGNWFFIISCKEVEPGIIFASNKITLINDDMIGEKVQENILYYVNEGTHPLFDLFFLCKNK